MFRIKKLSCRKGDGKYSTLAQRAFHPDRTTHGLGRRLHDIQAQAAGTVLFPALRRYFIETFKYMGQMNGRNPFTGISHAQGRPVPLPGYAQCNAAALRRMAQPIVD